MLRDADELLEPKVAETIAELNLGPQDAGVSALALTLARAIDGMDAETRGRMLGQTAGQLLATLKELQVRAARPRAVPSRPNRLDAMRAARWMPT